MSPEHKALIDALTALAANLIRGGADPKAVQEFVDGELARSEGKMAELKR